MNDTITIIVSHQTPTQRKYWCKWFYLDNNISIISNWIFLVKNRFLYLAPIDGKSATSFCVEVEVEK